MKRILLVLTAALVLAASATAAKPGNSLALDQTNPAFGDTISFTIVASFPLPQVNTLCYQNDVLVYSGLGDTANGFSMMLGSRAWTGGAAECRASLYEWRTTSGRAKTWASLEFSVEA